MRQLSLLAAVAMILAALALGPRLVGTAQEPLPTPRGQLGGRVPLQLTPAPPAPAGLSPTPEPATATPAAPTATATAQPSPEAPAAATPAPPTADRGEMTTGDLIASIGPAVVTVVADDGDGAAGSGSGFFVDGDGHVITSQRAVEGAGNLVVVLADGERRPATLTGEDELTGLALLQVEGDVPATAPLSAAADLAAGDSVLAFGTAFGTLPSTVTEGIVSVVDRRLPDGPAATALIQHDAATPRGMEGGPVVNTRGETVGVTVSVAVAGSGIDLPRLPEVELPDVPGVEVDLPQLPNELGPGSVLSFAVPAETVERVVASIIAEGRVVYPFIGVSVEPVTEEIAVVRGLAEPAGVVVREVTDDSPAAVAGLEADDIILAIDDQPLDQGASLTELLFAYAPGETVDLTVLRGGEEISLPVVLAERPVE